MSLWKELSTEQLYKLLESENAEQIHKRLLKYTKDKANEDFVITIAKIRRKYKDELTKYQIMQSIFSVVNSEASVPVVVLGTIAQSWTLLFWTVGVMTIVTAALTLAICAYFFVQSYREYKQNTEATKNDLDFTFIKFACAKEIIQRSEAGNAHDNIAAHKPFIKPFKFKNVDRARLIRRAIPAAIITFGNVLAVYYLAAATVVMALGVSAALFGPMALGIAFGVAIAISVFAVYKQYQALYNRERLAAYQEHLEIQLDKKCDQCDELRGVIKPKKLYSTQRNHKHNGHRQSFFDSSNNLQRRNFNERHTQAVVSSQSSFRPK